MYFLIKDDRKANFINFDAWKYPTFSHFYLFWNHGAAPVLDPSWTNMPFRKILRRVFTPHRTSDPLYNLWERQNIENLNFIFAVVQLTLMEHQGHLMENLKGFTFPTAAKCEKITIFDQNSPLEWDHGVYRSPSIFCLNVIIIPFRLTMNAFWPWQKQNSDFRFLAFPIGLKEGLRWRWGLKTHFKIFFKGHIC